MSELGRDFVLEQLPKAVSGAEDFDQERVSAARQIQQSARRNCSAISRRRARERGFAVQSAPTGQVIFIPLIDG